MSDEDAAWRWCTSGQPDKRPRGLPELLDGLDHRFVICGCAQPWICKDPNTISRAEQARAARRTETERCAPTGAAIFIDHA